MAGSEITVGLLWHSMNSDNLGVGALTLSNIAIVEEAAAAAGKPVKFKILGWKDPNPPYFSRKDIEVVELRARDINPLGGRLKTEVKSCDLVLDIGAGDSFSDIYGPARITKMILASNTVLAAGTPLIMSPQTIGPFQSSLISMAALSVMRRAMQVCSRDNLSTEFARQMGFEGSIIEASDVAIKLPFIACKEPNSITKIGMNVSGLLYNGGYDQNNMFGLKADYADLIERLAAYFLKQSNCELHLIGHVLSEEQEVEDDYRVCQKVAVKFPQAIVAPKFHSPTDAKSYIAGMDFMTGARMHACIAAFSAGVPVVPIAYSRKFAGFFGALGYDTIAECRSETADEIVAKVKNAFENMDDLRSKVEASRARGFNKLSAYELVVTDALKTARREAA